MSAAAENYAGELAMLRGLLGVLRVTAQHGDFRQMQQLLVEHEGDEQAAYVEEKATATAATATPAGAVFDPLPSYLHAIGHAGSETERGLYAGYVQAIAEVVRLQAATATASGPTGRVAQLLDAIRTHRGEWTTKRAQDLYRGTPLAPPNARNGRLRHVARGDLRDLHTWGHLVLHEETGRRFYTLKTRKDARS